MSNVEDLIEKISLFNLKDNIDIELKKLLLELGRYVVVEHTLHEGNIIERARLNNNGEVFTTVDEISYNRTPSMDYKRCTPPDKVIFYGSIPTVAIDAARATAMMETTAITADIKNENLLEERMTISRWVVKKPLTLIAIIGTKEFLAVNSDLLKTKETLDNFITAYPNDIENTYRINDFISSHFAKIVKEHHEYKISALFSEIIMEQNFDGMIYPSVQSEGGGLNVALATNAIDTNMIEPVIALQVKNYARLSAFVSDNEYFGHIKNGKIFWSDVPYDGHAGRGPCLKLLEQKILDS
jgi:hypothetical protein